MAESDQLVEALKEIRDELRALRTELVTRGGRMASSGVRTERVELGVRRRNATLAGVGLVALAIGLVLAVRDRSAPETATAPVAVASQAPATPAANPPTSRSMPAPSMIPAPAPVVQATQAVAHAAVPVAKPLAVAPTPATRQAPRLPPGLPAAAPTTTLASVPAAAKKRVKPDVAARVPAEVASDEDEPLAFPPPPRRVRAHRLSYGPVESEPAKL